MKDELRKRGRALCMGCEEVELQLLPPSFLRGTAAHTTSFNGVEETVSFDVSSSSSSSSNLKWLISRLIRFSGLSSSDLSSSRLLARGEEGARYLTRVPTCSHVERWVCT